MKKEAKWKYFVRMTHFLMGRYGFCKPLEVTRDNRLDCPCCVESWEDETKIKIKYHTRRLGQNCYGFVLSFLLHEIGHLENNLSYSTKEEVIESEYRAEKFAVDTMRKEHPKEYKEMLKVMMEKKSLVKIFKEKKCRFPYYWAFKKIKEYRITLTKEDLKWLKKKEKALLKK